MRVRAKTRHHIVIVVNLLEMYLAIYLDGEQVSRLTAEAGIMELFPDGPFALDLERGISLFASEDDSAMKGGQLTKVVVHKRALDYMQVQGLLAVRDASNQWNCPACTVVNLDSARSCKTCGTRRAVDSASAEESNPLLEGIRDMGFDVTQEDLDAVIAEVGQDPQEIANYVFSNPERFFH